MTTAAELFKGMPDAFNSEAAGDMEATVQFKLSGDNGGNWYVEVANGAASVSEGEAGEPTATIMMDAADYVAMVQGELNAMTAFMTGKVKVEGDLNTVMKFQTLFG